ncbi:MAG: 1,4-alpha-glucan branching protein GlgB [Clostridia bacterium]|nr:1,4-alpha-glucan branching protein GlgB [Clostridia bacterium]
MEYISDMDLYFFRRGVARKAYGFMGCRPDGGTHRFAVWAPNAISVSVIGDFNGWDPAVHEMEPIGDSGIRAIRIPGLSDGMIYKYHVRGKDGKAFDRTDPYAFLNEPPPSNASVIYTIPEFKWSDSAWMERRRAADILHSPVSIYEVHSSSFKRKLDGSILSWEELADELIPWVRSLGFTHIELMPITEYPLDASWGYQVTGYFSPTSRHGSPEGLMKFMDRCHKEGLGVILDWVPAHFPKDAHALWRFDGTALYEHPDTRLGEQPQWDTAVFNFSRHEVRSFLISSAVFWLDKYHFDGLRVDAVSSMLYRNFGREGREWLPNSKGGAENTEGVEFLRLLSESIMDEIPDAMLTAEEATAWPHVTMPASENGLGFTYKWNMGWMNDVLRYVKTPFESRPGEYGKLTFGMHYAFSENYILPFSHDEVIHGKKTLLDKMPGSYEQKFAGLRALIGYMYSHPGLKLLFMGTELAPFMEWRYYGELEWQLLDYPIHDSFRKYIADINSFYAENPPLWDDDHSWDGFNWIQADDPGRSVIAFERIDRNGTRILSVSNFMPGEIGSYRLAFPCKTELTEVFSSNSREYSGTGAGNNGILKSVRDANGETAHYIEILIPPLSTLYFKETANGEQ